MNTFWMIFIFLQGFSPVILKGYDTLQECKTGIVEVHKYNLLALSPLVVRSWEPFCVSNRGNMESLNNIVT